MCTNHGNVATIHAEFNDHGMRPEEAKVFQLQEKDFLLTLSKFIFIFPLDKKYPKNKEKSSFKNINYS